MDKKTDSENKSNLHHAVAERFTNLVQSLLEQEENQVNTPDAHGRTPLHLVCSNIQEKDLPLFLKCESEYLPCRTLKETEKIIELLICHGADLEILDKTGKSPLHCLVDHWLAKLYPIEQIKKMITQFLQCGANINGKDGNGRTLLHYVAGSADMKVPRVTPRPRFSICGLFQPGNPREINDKSTKKDDQVTPENQLYRKEFLVMLLNSGADMNSGDDEGFTPLHLAIAANQFEVVKELLVGKPVVNVQNNQGQTPLHYAVSNSDRFKYCGILMLHKGALASTTDIKGITPLDIAKDLPEFSTFLKHLILLIHEKVHPEMKIFDIRNPFVNLMKYCMQECEHLKSYFEQHGKSQLHLILRSHSLPVYTRNDFFHSKITNEGFKRAFPNYSYFLKYKFFQDNNRMKMIENCTSVFSCFGGFFQYSSSGRLMYKRNTHWEGLPVTVKLQILSYLSNDELEYLKKHL